MSARDKKVEGHWDTLDKSSSTVSSCRLSWIVPGSCRAMTIALVLSARSILWRHRSRAWLTSCRAFDTPHGACRGKSNYKNKKTITHVCGETSLFELHLPLPHHCSGTWRWPPEVAPCSTDHRCPGRCSGVFWGRGLLR